MLDLLLRPQNLGPGSTEETMTMFKRIPIARGLALAGAHAASTTIISSANAGECPADKRKADESL
jgi:hypothetical protein